MRAGGIPWNSRRVMVFAVLAAAHLAFSLFVNPAGPLTYDSGTYHFMVKNFAGTGSFIVENGYRDYPSPELEVAQLRISDDRLVSQYPELLTVLALPFYLSFGYQGLLIFNALSFLAITVLVFQLARQLFDSPGLGDLAAAIYALATFAWEYSHSSYPHLSSTLFILAAYTLAARALAGGSATTGKPWFAAGLCAGLAVGLRLDAAFAVPGLFLLLLLSRPLRVPPMLALVAGLAPGFVFLSLTNKVKFDSLIPFSYGVSADSTIGNLGYYVPISIVGLAALVALFFVPRLPRTQRSKLGWWAAAGLAGATAIYHAGAWRLLSQFVDGTFQIVVDMRIRDLDLPEPSLMRTPGGAMVYIGGVKKSLLQSCSYLAIVPLLAFGSGGHELRRLVLLAIVPVSFISYYGFLAWHGSVALNMRYLNPILPFTSILAALAWRRVEEQISPRLAALYGGVLFAALFVIFRWLSFPIPEQEFWFLTLPLVLAAALLLSEIARRLKWTPTLGGPLVGYLLLTSFAYSGAMAFGRDYPASARVRGTNLEIARALEPFIEDNALIFSNVVDICWGLMDHVDNLRIAHPEKDAFETFPGLAGFHLDHGRKVYMAYTPNELQTVGAGGHLEGLGARVINVWTTGGRPSLVLLELERRPEETAS